MNKTQAGRTIHTAPIKLHGEAVLVRELARYQKRLDAAHLAMKRKRLLGHEPSVKASVRGQVDVGAAVASVMTDIATDEDYGLILHWEYTVKKLQAAVGVLEVERDTELAGLRKFMKHLKLT
jgi:hypothetical protein